MWGGKKKDNKCAHPSCNCPPAKGGKYCSEYCKDARGSMELSCNCRHEGCGMTAVVKAAS